MHWERTLIPLFLFTASTAAADEISFEELTDDRVPQELLELRADLAEDNQDSVLAAKAYYRPLCDAEGYPLVGNLLPKTPDDSMPAFVPQHQPSEFCRAVREDSASGETTP